MTRTAKITEVPRTLGGDTYEVVMYEDGEYINRAIASSDDAARIAADWVKATHAELIRDNAKCDSWIADLRAWNDPAVHVWEDLRAANCAKIATLIS